MTEDPQGTGARPLPVRWLVAFGRFWWDFLIGDTPELFVGALVLLGALAGITLDHGLNVLAYITLPVGVFLLIGGSVHRAARSARRPPADG